MEIDFLYRFSIFIENSLELVCIFKMKNYIDLIFHLPLWMPVHLNITLIHFFILDFLPLYFLPRSRYSDVNCTDNIEASVPDVALL